jgi:hypothetical protein
MSFLEALHPDKAGPGRDVLDPSELSLSSTASSSSSGSSEDGHSDSPMGIMRIAPSVSPMVSPEKDGLVLSNSQSEDGDEGDDRGVYMDTGTTTATATAQSRRAVACDDDDHTDAVFDDVQRGFRRSATKGGGAGVAGSPKTLFSDRNLNRNSDDSSNDDSTQLMRTTTTISKHHPLPRRHSRDRRRKSSRTKRSSGESEMASNTHSVLLDDFDNNRSPLVVRRRSSQRELSGESFGSSSARRSSSQQYLIGSLTPSGSSLNCRASDSFIDQSNSSITPEISSESSPDSSPSRPLSGTTQKVHQHQQGESQYHSNSISRTSLNSINDSSGTTFSSFSLPGQESLSLFPKLVKKTSSKSCFLAGTFFCMVVVSAAGTLFLTNHAGPMDDIYKVEHSINRPDVYPSAAGLRGKMVLGRWEDNNVATPSNSADTSIKPRPTKKATQKTNDRPDKNAVSSGNAVKSNKKKKPPQKAQPPKSDSFSETSNTKVDSTSESAVPTVSHFQHPYLEMRLPPPLSMPIPYKYDRVDPHMYGSRARIAKQSQSHQGPATARVVMLDPSATRIPRKIKPYPADFTDNTQLYGILPSDDERLSKMEIRAPYSEGECVPMQEWQTTFHPWCNGMHELPLHHLGSDTDGDLTTTASDHDVDLDTSSNLSRKNPYGSKYYGRLNAFLFGVKGFWRYAWRVDIDHVDNEKGRATDTIVLKTLKYVDVFVVVNLIDVFLWHYVGRGFILFS